jgi:hypothetical protein
VQHQSFIGQIENFITLAGGEIKRFPVPVGSETGARSVKNAIADGLKNLIEEFDEQIANFDKGTRDKTIEQKAEEIEKTKFKIEVYATYLAERKEYLEHKITESEKKLKAKVKELGKNENSTDEIAENEEACTN